MKEMVSWRGVAKKRRKQEPAGRLTKCSSTVAVTQQSWPGGNHYSGLFEAAALPLGQASLSESPGPSTDHNLRAIDSEVSPTRELPRASSRDQTEFSNAPRCRELRQAQFARHLQRLIFDRRHDARTEVTTPDINRVRKGSRHFCAAGTFCARFRHAMTRPPRARSRRSQSFIARRNNVVCNLSQTF